MSIKELHLLISGYTRFTAQNIRMHFQKCVKGGSACLLRTNYKEGGQLLTALGRTPDILVAWVTARVLLKA